MEDLLKRVAGVSGFKLEIYSPSPPLPNEKNKKRPFTEENNTTEDSIDSFEDNNFILKSFKEFSRYFTTICESDYVFSKKLLSNKIKTGESDYDEIDDEENEDILESDNENGKN